MVIRLALLSIQSDGNPINFRYKKKRSFSGFFFFFSLSLFQINRMKKLIALSLLSLFFTACKKEKYEGSQSFWFNQLTSHDLMELADVTTLTFYVDDEFVSTTPVTAYKTSTPACKEGQFLYVEKMYKKETAIHTFKVVDQNNYVFWNGKFKTEASKCNIAQLSF